MAVYFYSYTRRGIAACLFSPLQIDYLSPTTMGKSGAMGSIVGLIGSLTATSGTLKMQEHWSMNTIFQIYGVLVIAFGFFLMFGLTEIFRLKQEKSPSGSCMASMR